MPQQSMSDFVNELDKAGLLVRIKDEKRVDELPMIMDRNTLKAVYVEKVKDCQFSFLANAYSNLEQYSWALKCDKAAIGQTMAKLAAGRIKPEIVNTAPCKEVIVKGQDVDLTILPLFLHHDRDGTAFIQDLNFVSTTRTPAYNSGMLRSMSGLRGIYRSMFRTKSEVNIDMTCETHRCRINRRPGGRKARTCRWRSSSAARSSTNSPACRAAPGTRTTGRCSAAFTAPPPRW